MHSAVSPASERGGSQRRGAKAEEEVRRNHGAGGREEESHRGPTSLQVAAVVVQGASGKDSADDFSQNDLNIHDDNKMGVKLMGVQKVVPKKKPHGQVLADGAGDGSFSASANKEIP